MTNCATQPNNNQNINLRFPGGVTIQPMLDVLFPTKFQIAKNLLSQLSSALTPLMPVFNIIDSIIAIKDFASSVPEIIVNPASVIEAVANLIEKVSKLVSLIPQLSLPVLIVDIIDLLILVLEGFVEELTKIQNQITKITNARNIAVANNLPELEQSIICAELILSNTIIQLNNSLGPLNSLIGIISIFMKMIGLDSLGSLSNLSSNPSQAIDTLQVMIQTLATTRDLIPIP